MLLIIWEVILPVFLIFYLGFFIQKKFRLDIRSISVPAIHVLFPTLAFTTFFEAQIDSTYLYILIYSLGLTILLISMLRIYAFIAKLDPSEYSAFLLSTVFMNNGNFGVPVVLFAFGQAAVLPALAIMILHLVQMSTIGVFFAARGHYSIRDSLVSVLKMPVVHAALLAFILRGAGVSALPDNFYSALKLLSEAAIPLVMVVFGMQLAEISTSNIKWNKMCAALIIRLVLSPILAFLLVAQLPVSPVLGNVMIVQASMPTAVVTTMYALEYNSRPDFVSAVTLISTLLSAITITALLMLL